MRRLSLSTHGHMLRMEDLGVQTKVTAVVAVILYTVLVRVDVTMYMKRPLLVGFSLWDGDTNAASSSESNESTLVADGEMARATSAAAPEINNLGVW